MSVSIPKLCKKIKLSIYVRQTKKKEVEFTFLIAILFFVHLRVNVATTLIFFLIYLSVMFIHGLLRYFK